MYKDLDVHEDTNTLVLFKETPEGTNMLEVVDSRTGKNRLYTSKGYVPLSPRISPTGKEIAFGCMDGKIYSMSLADGKIIPIVDIDGVRSSFGVWSADGSTLCFSGHKDSRIPPNIYTLDMNCGEIIQQTNCNRCIDRFPHISPCSRYIVFTRHQLDEPNMPGRAMLLNVIDGNLVQLPQRDNTHYEIGRGCWSADSEHVILSELSDGKRCLQIYHVSSNSFLTTLSFPDLQGGFFFQQEKKVLVICQHEILVVSMIDGRIKKKFPLPEAISIAATQRGPAAVLNPDATKVYICNEASSIYLIDLMHGKNELIIKDFVHNLSEKEEYEVVSYDGLHIPVHHFKPEKVKELGVHLGYHLPRAYPIDPEEKLVAKIERNPLHQAAAIKSPLLIVHGGQDTTSSNEEVLEMKLKIEEHGGRCEVIIYEDGAHGLGNHRKEVFKELLSFLEGAPVSISNRGG
ncbi:dienelactone hydrolase family protein [Sporosarcina sp. FSL W8-0480]|uniref:S9 family peptidase n=1 Tax=Sporosarcina sp. FSL W8-0480 TaxID=2954701 RepID=UPI0030DCFCFE